MKYCMKVLIKKKGTIKETAEDFLGDLYQELYHEELLIDLITQDGDIIIDVDGEKDPNKIINIAKTWNEDTIDWYLRRYFDKIEREYKRGKKTLYDAFLKTTYSKDATISFYDLMKMTGAKGGVIQKGLRSFVYTSWKGVESYLNNDTLEDVIRHPKEYAIISLEYPDEY